MKKRGKNPSVEIEGVGEIPIDSEADTDPMKLPPWFNQFVKLSDENKKKAVESALNKIKRSKPDVYEFLKKYCKLVGVTPRMEYALSDQTEGETDVTWVHSYSQVTLVFWCKEGFTVSINASLDYRKGPDIWGFIY